MTLFAIGVPLGVLMCLASFFGFIAIAASLDRRGSNEMLILLVIALIGAASLWLVVLSFSNSARLTSRTIWRRRHLSRGQCPNCRYSTHGLTEPRCPECGERWEDDPAL
jgi:hypothetical protein